MKEEIKAKVKMVEKEKLIAPCKNCGKETYNTTKEWSGYCSRECEIDAQIELETRLARMVE